MAPDFHSYLVLVYRPLPRCLLCFVSPYTPRLAPNTHADFFFFNIIIVLFKAPKKKIQKKNRHSAPEITANHSSNTWSLIGLLFNCGAIWCVSNCHAILKSAWWPNYFDILYSLRQFFCHSFLTHNKDVHILIISTKKWLNQFSKRNVQSWRRGKKK